MATKVAVIYYSAAGNVYGLARAVEEGAREAGAEVRFRKVRELALDEAIKSNQGWYDHSHVSKDVPELTAARYLGRRIAEKAAALARAAA